MELLVARHGETDWNAISRLCGRTDLPLNENGKMQANVLAKALQKLQLPIDLIIASPLLRAQQTAGIVAERLNLPVQTEDRLIEQNYGDYEGGSTQNPDFIQNKRQFAYRYPNGESMLQVGYRVYSFLEELKQRTELNRVLLVSHGGACRLLNTYFEDETNEAFFQWSMQNAELRRYTLPAPSLPVNN